MGIRVVMLTGDNERTAKAIGAQAGVDEVIAGVLPDGKESVIRKLMKQGKVAMVGDGINDAPALTRADIGIAIGAGTDVAIDAADVVLMKSQLSDVPAAIRMSRATLRNIHQNLFWAFFYNSIGIPIAAGCFVWAGITLNPMLGAAAMSLSSFCVVTNALRLNLFKMYDASKDKPRKHKQRAETPAEDEELIDVTMRIDGMMCGHCEKTVTEALEAVEGVEGVTANAEKGIAKFQMSPETSEQALKDAVTIPVGFHGHSNLGLSQANALAAAAAGADEIDCGLLGMARSAGNCATELAAATLQRAGYLPDVDLYGLLHYLDETLIPAMRGYDYHVAVNPTELMLGLTGCHSAFLPLFQKVAREEGVSLLRLIADVSAIDRKSPSEALLRETAQKLK